MGITDAQHHNVCHDRNVNRVPVVRCLKAGKVGANRVIVLQERLALAPVGVDLGYWDGDAVLSGL